MSDLRRWRLVLGEAGQACMGGQGLDEVDAACDAALSWLYDRDQALGDRDIMGQAGGSGASHLTVPDWINEVHRLFPQETIERLERDAVMRYHIDEVVTNPDVLRRLEPNLALLEAVLKTKHLMRPEVLALARQMVGEVVRQLMEKLAVEVQRALTGRARKRRSAPLRSARLDPRTTIRQNLRHWSIEEQRLYIEHPWFHQSERRTRTQWQIILLVDESGSMLTSVIHAAVMAACLWGLPSIRTHLAIFDTSLVDLSDAVDDPVEVLMKVQLGGGTDIGQAVAWARQQVVAPRRAIVVLVTDFYEGANPYRLVSEVRALCEQGTHVLGLAALDPAAHPRYDREMAEKLVEVGAHVAAMTPGQLAAWIGEKIG
ncbi:MAG TPA: VWA domain-containing protein [Candidatus Xenobia bacterium]|jgi:uncharacterized protein with von Willebrand factor type A (vWA) domain